MENQIYFAIRFDDPAANSKHEVEIRTLEELIPRRIPATFAVIPFRRSGTGHRIAYEPRHAKHFKEGLEQGLVEVALHGYTHTNAGLATDGANSEFAGVAAQKQKALVVEGKKHLEAVFGPVISGFVPPFNSYDHHTLRAVEAAGLRYLSADRRPPPSTGIPILPVTCKLHNLKEAVTEARRFISMSPVIILVLHHYDFDRDEDDPPGKVHTYEQFGTLLDWMTDQPDLRILPLHELADRLSHRPQRWPRHDRLRAALPWRFKHWLPRLCFGSKGYRFPLHPPQPENQ